jgi:hypothetical protein
VEYIRRIVGILHPLEVELASLVKVFQLLIELLANGEIHQQRIGLSVRLEQKDAGSLEKGGFYVPLFCLRDFYKLYFFTFLAERNP